MPQSKAEQIKLYVIMGLMVVAAVVAYFSFFHKKKAPAATPAPATATAGPTVPEIKIKPLKSTAPAKSQVPEIGDIVLRNIFSPARWPKRAEAQPEVEEPDATDVDDMELEMAETWLDEERQLQPKPFPHVKLLGTLIGGKNPIAVIDGRFMRAGDAINQYKIVKITPDEVLLKYDDKEVVLKVLTSGVDQ
ncbi:MAG: hypothetical protein V3S66_06450 [Desulfobacterales bacterium]